MWIVYPGKTKVCQARIWEQKSWSAHRTWRHQGSSPVSAPRPEQGLSIQQPVSWVCLSFYLTTWFIFTYQVLQLLRGNLWVTVPHGKDFQSLTDLMGAHLRRDACTTLAVSFALPVIGISKIRQRLFLPFSKWHEALQVRPSKPFSTFPQTKELFV